MKKTLGVAVVVVLIVLLALYWRSARTPAPGQATAGAGAGKVSLAALPGELGGCDQQPAPPPLPATLSPPSADLPGIVAALDAALNDQHKAWIRCFTLDAELLARTHQGLGRWLRTTLRIRQRPPLLNALGAKAPDEASSIIILAYSSHLRGRDLSPAEARARRLQALADAGVTP